MGVSDDHMVIAGAVVDYSYKQELMAFMLAYLNIPGMKPEYATYTYERNSRLFLQMREDFLEEKHFNDVGVKTINKFAPIPIVP